MTVRQKIFCAIANSALHDPIVSVMRFFIRHPLMPSHLKCRFSDIGMNLIKKYPSQFTAYGEHFCLQLGMPSDYHDWLSKLLFWYHLEHFEIHTREIISRILFHYDNFIDIGSHIGFYSLYVKKYRSSINVISFEPNPLVFKILKKNIQMNKLNIHSFPLGLSEYTRKSDFYHYPTDLSLGSLVPREKLKFQRYNVDIIRFDDFVQKYPLSGKSLIKIDAEGSEQKILMGMRKYLRHYKPTVICEILDKDEAGNIESVFADLNYAIFKITSEGIQKSDHIEVGEGQRESNWLFAPYGFKIKK